VGEIAAEAPDIDALVKELQQRVQARFEAGEYPPDLERELRAHFEDVVRERQLPDRFAELMRRVDDAAAFSPHRIQLISSLPGGRRLHGLIASVVRRQVTGILDQNRLFAIAVRDLLTRIIQSLPEQQAAAGTTWWDIPEDYQERLYDTRDAVVGTLAALAASLKVPGPVLVLETGRGELLTALRKEGMDAEAGEGNPLIDLDSRPDRSLAALALRRVIERLPAPEFSRLAGLAARKLRAGGRLGLQGIAPGRLHDPALPHPLPPDYIAFTLEAAGFGHPQIADTGKTYLLTTTLSG